MTGIGPRCGVCRYRPVHTDGYCAPCYQLARAAQGRPVPVEPYEEKLILDVDTFLNDVLSD